MAVIRQDRYLWGLIRKEREIPPGTIEPLSSVHMRTIPGVIIGETLHVITPDEVAEVYGGVVLETATRRRCQQINIDRFPPPGGLWGAAFGRRVRYTWRPSPLPPAR